MTEKDFREQLDKLIVNYNTANNVRLLDIDVVYISTTIGEMTTLINIRTEGYGW